MTKTDVRAETSRHKKNDNNLASSRKRILIADDDPGIRDVLAIIFKNSDYIADIKASGEDILRNDFEVPDLFLIDKQLSGTCGLDICRQLKASKRTGHIPVVIMSALPGVGKLAQEAGADCFLAKPFDIKGLLKLIDACINKAESK
jgi:DNA-binding response OmpR family regulator